MQGSDGSQADGRKGSRRVAPANKLSEEERQQILTVANSPEFASSPPSQIVPTLADRDEYLASESTVYRILKDEKQQHHRGRAKKPSTRVVTSHCATAPIGDKVNKIIGRLADANDSLKGAINVADFNDEEKLGKGKEMVDRLTKLVAIFEGLDFGGNRAGGDDLLGDA